MSTVTWDAILVTVDGFGFGTLTGESCLKNVHCHTDRASWDAILVTVVAFGALMWKKCAQSHRFGLGRVGNREPGSYIQPPKNLKKKCHMITNLTSLSPLFTQKSHSLTLPVSLAALSLSVAFI